MRAPTRFDAPSDRRQYRRHRLRAGNFPRRAGERTQRRQDRDRLERLYRDDPGTISLRRLEMSRATSTGRQPGRRRPAEVQRAREQEGGSDEDNAKLRSADHAGEG